MVMMNEHYLSMRNIIQSYLSDTNKDETTLLRIKDEIKALHMNGLINSDEEGNLLMMLPSINDNFNDFGEEYTLPKPITQDTNSFSNFATSTSNLSAKYNNDNIVSEKEVAPAGFSDMFSQPSERFYNSRDDLDDSLDDYDDEEDICKPQNGFESFFNKCASKRSDN